MAAFVLPEQRIKLFSAGFKALTGHAPFPWQTSLFLRFASESFPASISLPTAAGKTSIMALWLLALAEKLSDDPKQAAVPRRLVWALNRGTVVDQATREAEDLRQRLSDAPAAELEPIRRALGRLRPDGSGEILPISTLRGGFEDNAAWRGDPSRPAVIVGPVDRIGSRLLFSGYGDSFTAKPLYAGLLGQDVLVVHDEAHLEPAFRQLLLAIQEEQKRSGEAGRFRVISLSAIPEAAGDAFGLTEPERRVPDSVPEPPETPLQILWRRQSAKKTIYWHQCRNQARQAEQLAELALSFRDSGCAILVFATEIEDVEKIVRILEDRKQDALPLTGTRRGRERDQLVAGNAIFLRFLSPTAPADRTVYLVCTSAGELGANLCADHLICDLSTFDRMVQRLGRVNRFGNRNDTQVHIVCPSAFRKGNEREERRKKTLTLLGKLPENDASPRALGRLSPEACLAAFAPAPEILPTSDLLFDSWALTSIRGALPGRPPVAPYLHGLGGEPPDTRVAWREEVGVVAGELLKYVALEDLLESYPLKPHELLRDRSDRIHRHLSAVARRHPEAPAWLLAEDGSVAVFPLKDLVQARGRDRIQGGTVLLPPGVGGLSVQGMIDGDSDTGNDVADASRDAKSGMPYRLRVWDLDPQPTELLEQMRLIRSVDTAPWAEDPRDDGQAAARRHWHWYELPKWADNEGSERGAQAVSWRTHTQDVIRNAARLVERLPLAEQLRSAIVLAARFHDCGKRRSLFQRMIGNRDPDRLLAKSGKKSQSYTLNENFRHEFASLIDLQKDELREQPEFRKLSEDTKDLVLHLIAAHHGRGRPHFRPEEAFDPESAEQTSIAAARQVPPRFARLQRGYGRWGLAYLESLLRAADDAAGAEPSSREDGP